MANRQFGSGDMLVANEAQRARIEQKRHQQQVNSTQKQLIQQVTDQARQFINQDKAQVTSNQKAADLAFKCFKESANIFGQDSIQLMPLYFQLADSNLKIGRKKRAEGFLIGADWTLIKHQPSENQRTEQSQEFVQMLSKLRSRLLKSFGGLFTEMGNYHQALKYLTQNIYLESLDKGPQHYSLSGSFYLMGKNFEYQNRKEEALNFYRQMQLIWKRFLDNPDLPENVQPKRTDVEQGANEIKSIIELVHAQVGQTHDIAVEIRKTFNDLCEFINEMDKKAYRQARNEEEEEQQEQCL